MSSITFKLNQVFLFFVLHSGKLRPNTMK